MDDRGPEVVLVAFLVANLRGVEAEIRPLIVDHPDADVLWEGAYPPDVAERLAAQYQSMEIGHFEDGPGRVLLTSTASPIPIAVVRLDGAWRVDVSEIVAFRKAVKGRA